MVTIDITKGVNIPATQRLITNDYHISIRSSNSHRAHRLLLPVPYIFQISSRNLKPVSKIHFYLGDPLKIEGVVNLLLTLIQRSNDTFFVRIVFVFLGGRANDITKEAQCPLAPLATNLCNSVKRLNGINFDQKFT